jgi:hypothetical protein
MLAGAVLLWIFFGFVGCAIGSKKDRAVDGFLMGAFLGPVGWCWIGLGGANTIFLLILLAGVNAIGIHLLKEDAKELRAEDLIREKQEESNEKRVNQMSAEASGVNTMPAPTPTPVPGAWMWRQR